jgi:4'-phosphopantetheinyl transferase
MIDQSIHLYFGLLDTVDTPQAFAMCLAALSSAERQRAERFVLERHRRQYVLAHGLLRVALSSVACEIDPADWCFVANCYGRPFIAAPTVPRPIYFSLSHTEGCVACVVSSCEVVGVDVEEIRQLGSLLATAECHFSLEEVSALRVLRPTERIDRFFDYWTLKEAYLKARGIGLRLSLNRFSMLLGAEQNIRIMFASGFGDDPQRWRFTKSSPSTRHRLAIADGSGLPGGLPIVVQPWPLPYAAYGARQRY